ncbi:peroxidase 2-like precursor [Cucumis sativus]|uniref:Peroxidase n=1 Tax=Cucumis sativus TaxID=3659 RepID=Q39652_CUCSA|nr:peroxidase 2-like precursor [Cucumis sativus]AAA33127.1 peroxidase [Cucumis sativus]
MGLPKMAAIVVVVALMLSPSQAQLSPFFYATTCPQLPFVVLNVVAQALQTDDRAAAKLIRLHFHDCFVNGCDGSILLVDVPGVIDSELNGPPNGGIQGMDIVDNIKAAVESACPGVVSCADILAISSQISVFLSGGPIWVVPMGRKDSRIANRTGTSNLPGPSETLVGLKGKFKDQGLDSTDLVALSGAHTFGKSRCMFFSDRLINFNGTGRPDTTLDPIYREQLRRLCTTQQTRVNFDPVTPTRFDKTYYNNLISLRGLLQSDQELFSTPRADTTAIVKTFAANERAFFKQFVKSMIKMGNLKPPPGIASEVRLDCKRVNPVRAYDVM